MARQVAAASASAEPEALTEDEIPGRRARRSSESLTHVGQRKGAARQATALPAPPPEMLLEFEDDEASFIAPDATPGVAAFDPEALDASIDPPPSIDAETLAAYLYMHAETARQKSAVLDAKMRHEEAAEALALAETEALRAELAQYHGWLAKEVEGGEGFRLSVRLSEERKKRAALEEDVVKLRIQLGGIMGKVKQLDVHGETPEQQQVTGADAALGSLERLRRLSEQAAYSYRRQQELAHEANVGQLPEPQHSATA